MTVSTNATIQSQASDEQMKKFKLDLYKKLQEKGFKVTFFKDSIFVEEKEIKNENICN